MSVSSFFMTSRVGRKFPQHSSRYKRMAKVLRQVRMDAGLSQDILTARAGFYASLVAKTELGSRRLDAIELIKWSEACGRDPAEIIKLL